MLEQKPVLDETEVSRLQTEIAVVGQSADALTVTDEDQLQAAADLVRAIQKSRKEVADFYSAPKKEASAVHKGIVAKEKQALAPLDAAESLLRAKMTAYITERDKRLLAAKESVLEGVRKLSAPDGDDSAGDMPWMDNSLLPRVEIDTPKVDGLQTRVLQRFEIVDESLVPVSINGIVLRPVDSKALQTIATQSKGKAIVPGVRFYEETSIAIRNTSEEV